MISTVSFLIPKGLDATFGLDAWLTQQLALSLELAIYVRLGILLFEFFIICYLAWYFTRNVVIRAVHKAFIKSKATWDDVLIKRGVFGKLAYLLPALLFKGGIGILFSDFEMLIPALHRASDVVILVIFLWATNALLSAIGDILSDHSGLKDKPVISYIQVIKIVVFIIGSILTLSLMLGKSPIYFLGAMGAMGAVLLLVFKDTILGFVASIQISVYDIVREGDWITMPKHEADGDVIAINLNTVKVQNWDKTITTLPTYALVSESFKNWRGMSESGGRRIKRSIRIQLSSIKFCSAELLEKFAQIQLIEPYITHMQQELVSYNKDNHIDTSLLVNGRHLTNVGVFRIYVEYYIKSLDTINQSMIGMVRQLEPDEKGLPIEIYCFSANKEWVAYEKIISDIFDHLLASIPLFDLKVYEYPSGALMPSHPLS